MDYERIDMLRQKRKIRKMEFYRLIGMTETGYKNMRISNSIKVSTLQKIAEVLKVSIFELLGTETSPAESFDGNDLAMPPVTAAEDTSDIMDLDIEDAEKMILLREQISMLILKLKITTKMSENRKAKIEKLEEQLANLIKQ
jgi:DNA-binding Xre family transcriptional regulator